MSLAVEFPLHRSGLQTAQPQYSIIVPAYNERARIGGTLERILEHLNEQNWSAEILVVNDGSRDDTMEVVSRYAAEHPQIRLIQNPGNQGKGYAVRNGMLNARGQYLLFTDADLSSPMSEAPKLFAELDQGVDVAIGSRWLDPSLQFQRQPLKRQIFSRIFNLFLRIWLGSRFRDHQCGFKAFTPEAARAIFTRQHIHRWGFDAETIFLARKLGLKVKEIPVRWGHDDRSTIHPLRDGLRMGMDPLKVTR